MNIKLIGSHIQYLEVTLAPGEEFYAEKGSLIYIQPGVQKEVQLNGNTLGRLLGAKLSGESLFIMQLLNNSQVERKIAIGGWAGLIPIKLETNQQLFCHKGVYVGSSKRVNVTTKLSIQGMISGMGIGLQKISGDATVILDTNGTPITIDLQPGEMIEVDEKHIIALQNIYEHQMQANWSFRNILGGEGLSTLNITGPGRIYLSPGAFPNWAIV